MQFSVNKFYCIGPHPHPIIWGGKLPNKSFLFISGHFIQYQTEKNSALASDSCVWYLQSMSFCVVLNTKVFLTEVALSPPSEDGLRKNELSNMIYIFRTISSKRKLQ